VRYLILSDLHANRQALDAVMADAGRAGYDHVLLLGDLVGYGADPAAVMDRALALAPLTAIRGNHDKVCAGLESAESFNDVARSAAEWTMRELDAEHAQTLGLLPKGPVQIAPDLEICHGAPFDEDFYVFDEDDAARALQSAHSRVCLFGHTHVPTLFSLGKDEFAEVSGEPGAFLLPATGRALINVGSVGQPRDQDPRAAYGVLDLEGGVLRLRRVEYDIRGAQEAIAAAGLPARLALRLERGI
jgi:predicted phosphodiesterase